MRVLRVARPLARQLSERSAVGPEQREGQAGQALRGRGEDGMGDSKSARSSRQRLLFREVVATIGSNRPRSWAGFRKPPHTVARRPIAASAR